MNQLIRIAVCSMTAPGERGPVPRRHRLDEARTLIRRAADQGAGWVCLPEWLGSWCTIQPEYDEPHPAPPKVIHDFLVHNAREFGVHLVCSYITEHADGPRNTAVLMAKDGTTVGEYHKVHLTEGELKSKTRPGMELPVFELDGVKVGMQLCYDLSYPEGCRVLALRGADVIFWPHIWRNTTPQGEIIARARAIENLVFLCGSSYVSADPDQPSSRQPLWGLTAVIGWDGRVLAQPSGAPSVAVAEVDIAQLRSWQSSRQKMLFEHRRPETYGPLVAGSAGEEAPEASPAALEPALVT